MKCSMAYREYCGGHPQGNAATVCWFLNFSLICSTILESILKTLH